MSCILEQIKNIMYVTIYKPFPVLLIGVGTGLLLLFIIIFTSILIIILLVKYRRAKHMNSKLKGTQCK